MASACSWVSELMPPLAGMAIDEPGLLNPFMMWLARTSSVLARRTPFLVKSGTPGRFPLPSLPWQATHVVLKSFSPSSILSACAEKAIEDAKPPTKMPASQRGERFICCPPDFWRDHCFSGETSVCRELPGQSGQHG